MRALLARAGATAVVAVSMSSAVAPAWGASFSNGDFEFEPVVGNFLTLSPGATHLTSWGVQKGSLSIGAGSIDQVNAYWVAHSGLHSLDLNGGDRAAADHRGMIFQTFDTAPGQEYEVSFWISGNPDLRFRGGVANAQYAMEVSAGNYVGTFTYQSSTNTRFNMEWERRSFVFVATGGATTLTFDATLPPGYFGAALDAVELRAVPAPSAAAGGAALLVCAWGVRRWSGGRWWGSRRGDGD